MSLAVSCKRAPNGEISIPGDKSVLHRAILFASLAQGTSRIHTDIVGRDNFASLRAVQAFGIETKCCLSAQMVKLAKEEAIENVELSPNGISQIIINGKGVEAFVAPRGNIFCGNSGTTARLITGILARCPFEVTLTGDESLSRRPFKRVREPLSMMGAWFSGDSLPLSVRGGRLTGIDYSSPNASAQVKSAIIVAGLGAEGPTRVTEPTRSRDHTERMLQAMGVELVEEATTDGRWSVSVVETTMLSPLELQIPGDFSAAAFFLVLGSIIPESQIRISGVGTNPTRTGLLDLLRRMGANIAVNESRVLAGEQVSKLDVWHSGLVGVEVDHSEVVRAIDEIPILAVAAACARGKTTIRGAQELRVKESDRLKMIAELLRDFEVDVEEFSDGLSILGRPELIASGRSFRTGGTWRESGDHRILMSGAVLELAFSGKCNISGLAVVETSFPNFVQCLSSLVG